MPVLTDKKSNFVSRQVDITTRLVTALEEYQNLRNEWDALGYSASLTDEDCADDNAHLSAGDLGDAFNTLAALQAVLVSGHWSNLYTLLP